MKIMKKDSVILWIILAFLIIQFAYFKKDLIILWDEAVYIGIGKYLLSKGTIGLFEVFRPLGLPLLLGILWKTGINIILLSKILAVLFSAGYIWASYVLSKRLFNCQVAIITAALISFTPLFFIQSSRVMTELPSTFFGMLAIYFFADNKMVLAGVLSGLAFLFKFPVGIIFLSLILITFYEKKAKNFYEIFFGFFLTLLPYFTFMKVHTGNFFTGLVAAQPHSFNPVHSVIGSLNYYYYILELLKQNSILIFFIPGLIFLKKGRYFTPLALYLAYFTYIPNKQPRFLLLFFPFFCMLAAFGVHKFIEHNKRLRLIRSRLMKTTVVLAVLLSYIPIATVDIAYYNYNKNTERPIVQKYYRFFENSKINNILTSDPVPAAYVDKKLIPFYFSAAQAKDIYEENKNKAGAIIFNPAGFKCEKIGYECAERIKELNKEIRRERKLLLHYNYESNDYFIYS